MSAMSFVSAVARRAAPRSARAFTTRAAVCDFGWSKLVTPLTNPGFIARMKELDNKFSGMKTEMHGVPEKVDPIDWAVFEKSITNKAVFNQIKAEYENIVYPEIKGEDLTKINADLDFSIEKASGAAAISAEEIPKLEVQLEAAHVEKKTIHSWTLEDYFKRYPGLEQQLRDEYMDGQYLPTDAEERIAEMDINELRKAFRNGTEVEFPEDMPERVGDLVFAEEQKRVDELLDRMFGGSKVYEQQKAIEQAQAARAAAQKHAEHH